MFTGIVQGLIEVSEIEHMDDISRLRLNLAELGEGLSLGASVAINGTCLTVVATSSKNASFDIIKETINTTNLKYLQKGSKVNVERSFRIGDEVGGHMVSGHISSVAKLEEQVNSGNERVLTFSVSEEWSKYILHKGYVALDGASITVSGVEPKHHKFSVSLIPETIARTTLGSISKGEFVNLEIDSQTQAIVETVERVMAERYANR